MAMDKHTEIAFTFCCSQEEEQDHQQVSTSGSGPNEVETDVEVLKATLSRLQEQQATIKAILDSTSIAFFKVDLRLFKRTLLPNISKAIVKLQESLPKVGREKMERFVEESRQLRETIEGEPKSSDDYVANMDIVDRINDKFDELEGELEAIDKVYAIMAEIPIPVSADDRASLKALKANMNTLGHKIQDRIRAQAQVKSNYFFP